MNQPAIAPRTTATKLGFEQRQAWYHRDLQHEEIPELELVDHSNHSEDLLELRFLILGDQNAGKTTFLYVLSDKSFIGATELLSHIPALSSNFVNSRFILTRQERMEVRLDELSDEPPFIDTDLARAAILLSSEAFGFLALESGIEFDRVSNILSNRKYVSLEFAEIGGDHLDRLVKFVDRGVCDVEQDALERTANEIQSQSLQIISKQDTAVYFVNTCTLLFKDHLDHQGSNGPSFHPARVSEIKERLELLRSLRPDLKLLFVCSRVPLGFLNDWPLLENLMKSEFGCQHVRIGKHFDEQGLVSVSGIVETVEALVGHVLGSDVATNTLQ